MKLDLIVFRNDLDDEQRWAWFIQKIDDVTRNVTAYFWQKGKWPVRCSGKMKYLFQRWYFSYNTDIGSSPQMMDYFAKKVFDLME